MVVPNSGARRGGVPTEEAVITADGCLLLRPGHRLPLDSANIKSTGLSTSTAKVGKEQRLYRDVQEEK